MSHKPTKRQKQILDCIRESILARGYPPSIREIGMSVGLCSSSTVHNHLNTMQARGYLHRDRSKPRSIQLLDMPGVMTLSHRMAILEELVARAVPLVADSAWREQAAALGIITLEQAGAA